MKENFKVDNAIILADSQSNNLVPLSLVKPVGLIEIRGESRVERLIKQLYEKGIRDITLILGYRSSQYKSLIKKYNLNYIFNDNYLSFNSLHSLSLAKDFLKNTYIISSASYLKTNIFSQSESYSWYCKFDRDIPRLNRALKIVNENNPNYNLAEEEDNLDMYEPVFLNEKDSSLLKDYLSAYGSNPSYKNQSWKYIIRQNSQDFNLQLETEKSKELRKFYSLDGLRLFDRKYINKSDNYILEHIARVFQVKEEEILAIEPITSGITNNSFSFYIGDEKYVCRVPGPGTEKLVNRENELNVYRAIGDLNISDELIDFDQDNYLKITKFIDNHRLLNPSYDYDVKRAIELLKKLHRSKIKLDHDFDILGGIDNYLKLCNKLIPSFDLNKKDRKNLDFLRELIKSFQFKPVLIHSDAFHENFLITREKIYLIDWEYAAMGDPVLDLAMMALGDDLSLEQINKIYKLYYNREISLQDKVRIYSYISAAGFLWHLWSLIKDSEGVELNTYSNYMYNKYLYFLHLVENILLD